ncbi:ATP synthase subunit ATP5MPL, mitochondrial [Lemmus lemmus]
MRPYFPQPYQDIWVAMELITFIGYKIGSADKRSKAFKSSVPSHGHH